MRPVLQPGLGGWSTRRPTAKTCASMGPDQVSKPRDIETERRGELGTLEKPKVTRPPLYEVLLHNDDYTTQEFVVYVLQKFFHHDAETAHMIMLHVHTKGIGVAGVFTYDVAETKVHLVTEFARQNEMPLKVTMRRQPGGEE